jgi:ATP-binding cassette, subfamily G (WHITE), eye pigment precursor transporter
MEEGWPEYAPEMAAGIFFICIAQLSLAAFSTVLEFLKERNVFVKEIAGDTYSVIPYFLSKQFTEFPLLCFLPLLEDFIMFDGIYFRKGTFWYIAIVYALMMQIGSSTGYFVSSIFSNMEQAAICTAFVIIPMIMFGGLLVNLQTLPAIISWAQYTSPLRFAFEALLWI